MRVESLPLCVLTKCLIIAIVTDSMYMYMCMIQINKALGKHTQSLTS